MDRPCFGCANFLLSHRQDVQPKPPQQDGHEQQLERQAEDGLPGGEGAGAGWEGIALLQPPAQVLEHPVCPFSVPKVLEGPGG